MREPNVEKITGYMCHCGHFHPEEDCEIILIKVIKGKNCEISNLNFFDEKKAEESAAKAVTELEKVPDVVVETPSVKPSAFPPGFDPAKPNEAKLLTPAEKEAYLKESAKGIPKEFMRMSNSVMIPPDDPRFESQGAKQFIKR
jgi:hypothetical protein